MSRPSSRLAVVAVGAIVLAFVAVILTTALMGIWPGAFTLAGRVLCEDAQPDAFVVSDTYSVRPGETVTEFTLYCVGPTGDATDVGFFRPFFVMTGVDLGILLVLTGVIWLATAPRRRRRRRPDQFAGPAAPPTGPMPPPPGSTAGPLIS